MKRIIALTCAFAIALIAPSSTAFAVEGSEIDALMNALINKGILSQGEAVQIMEDARTTAEMQQVEGGPSWVQKIKIKGDLRTRYQYENQETSGKPDVRHRGRIRFRLGAEAKVNDQVDVGFGFATGGTDGRSTNQTLGENNGFGTPDIRLDYAYARYKPMDGVEFLAGKFKNNLWKPSDLLWDGDLNPEGIGTKLNYSVSEGFDVFMNGGFYLLEESSSHNNEATLWAFQPGATLKSGMATWKNAATLYAFNDLKGRTMAESAGTNDIADYNWLCGAASTQLSFNFGKEAVIPYLAFFGDAVYNPDPERGGILGGIKFGDKKVKKPGQWQAKALYRYIDQNAWVDFLPDSDFLGGATGGKGPEFVLKYAVAKNVILAADYYYSEGIGSLNDKQHVMQLDCSYKF